MLQLSRQSLYFLLIYFAVSIIECCTVHLTVIYSILKTILYPLTISILHLSVIETYCKSLPCHQIVKSVHNVHSTHSTVLRYEVPYLSVLYIVLDTYCICLPWILPVWRASTSSNAPVAMAAATLSVASSRMPSRKSSQTEAAFLESSSALPLKTTPAWATHMRGPMAPSTSPLVSL